MFVEKISVSNFGKRVNHLNVAIDLLQMDEIENLLFLNIEHATEAKDKMAFDQVSSLLPI